MILDTSIYGLFDYFIRCFCYAGITIVVRWRDTPYQQQNTGARYYVVAMVMTIFTALLLHGGERMK